MSRDVSNIPRHTLTPRDEQQKVKPEKSKTAKAKAVADVNTENKEESSDAHKS